MVWFLNVELIFHMWTKSPLVWCLIIFLYCWILFANILLRFSVSKFMKDNWFVVFCCLLWYYSNIGLKNEFDSAPSCSISWRKSRKLVVSLL